MIDAVQLPLNQAPAWLADAMDAQQIFVFADGSAKIPTLEGEMTASPGDWIIYGVKGELYPCKPDIFAATYEPADAATSIADNQIITPRQMPGDDSVLERVDQAGDMVDDIGPPAVIAPYRKPKDPRVQQLLRDAEAARKAEQQVPREIFRDPRLEPGYRAPKSKK